MKLRFEQNKIVNETNKKVYNTKDATDMKILCHDVNSILQEKEFIIDDYQSVIHRIKRFLSVVEL